MKRLSWYRCLPLALPLCAPCLAAPEDVPPAVTVYTQFEQTYSAPTLDEMKRETAAIMGPLGLDFAWRSLGVVRGNEVSAELVVVTFKGDCEMKPWEGIDRGESSALGWTHISDGAVLPFSDVDCDKIRSFIGPELRTVDPKQREFVYGRAMGRVLAHELFHVFTNATHHGSWGVAKASYTARDLVAEHFEFEARDTKALRNGKLKSLLRARHRPPVLSFTGGRK